MFDTPAYASYIALMRELRPEWVWKEGDWYWSGGPARVIGTWDQGPEYGGEEPFPLPRLDQWLQMLEEAGVLNVRFVLPNETSLGNRLVRNGDCLAPRFNPGAEAPTNEEVAARLWMAVTGREVTVATPEEWPVGKISPIGPAYHRTGPDTWHEHDEAGHRHVGGAHVHIHLGGRMHGWRG